MSRIDDDDFVNRFAVQDTRDIIGTGDFDMIVCGYHHGYKYFSGVNKIEPVRRFYESGHMSVFQSIITNTHRVAFTEWANPCMFNHTKVRSDLLDKKLPFWFVSFERPDGYIYFRHPGAYTYSDDIKGTAVEVSNDMKERLNETFGFPYDGK